MVSGRPARGLGRDPRRVRRDRRRCCNFGTDEESFRAALRNVPRTHAARADRAATPPVELPKGAESEPADRLSGGGPAAGGRRRSPPSPTCSISGSPSRIVRISGRLRRPWPDLAAMQFPAYRAGAARGRGRGLVPVRPDRHRRPAVRREPADGLRDPRLRRPARDHARHGEPAVRARRRSIAVVLFFGWPVLLLSHARPGRHRLRHSRPRRRPARLTPSRQSQSI